MIDARTIAVDEHQELTTRSNAEPSRGGLHDLYVETKHPLVKRVRALGVGHIDREMVQVPKLERSSYRSAFWIQARIT